MIRQVLYIQRMVNNMKILLVIDMQNDFLHGTLRNEEGIKIIPEVVKRINEYKDNNCVVIATRDTHEENYLETQEGIKLPVVHCIKNTNGWEINDDVLKALGDSIIFDKPTFGSLELSKYLHQEYSNIQNKLEIEILGVCTDICVISNAMLVKATLPEAKIIVNSKLCAGVTVESHNNALKAMSLCQIEII